MTPITQMKESDIELVVAGSADSIVMVEGGASMATEADMVGALEFAHEHVKPIVAMIDELKAEVGKPKQDYEKITASDELIVAGSQLDGKHEREEAMDDVLALVRQETEEEFADQQRYVYDVTHDIQSEEMRKVILESGKRHDGRQPEDIRDITCEVSVLPETHGSALFTRGETQALTVTTLGTKQDEQRMDELEGESWKSYMLHYNFPSFSVGEVRPVRGPSRRDIGHGMLAERALRPVIPTEEFFPYTIRIVSDILESNGSSSMATVCAGSLSLMDTGVPIKEAVAGIAMGLIHEGDKDVILTDITGTEDHLGDMDFKVAGTRGGITSIQMDIKIDGVSRDLLAVALDRAREARVSILDSMKSALETPRTELNEKAPRIISLKINPSKIGEVIGPGGKVIRSIQESTGAKIDIDNDGLVTIASVDKDACEQAFAMVSALVEEAEVNEVEDVLREGDKVRVKCIGTDDNGKIKLSLKAAIEELDEESVWIQKVPR